MMRSVGIIKNIVSIVEKIYDKTVFAVFDDGLLNESFSVSFGVRQGCILYSTLFNLFLDFVMDEIKCLQDCFTLDKDLNFDVRYANDTALIASVFERLQLTTDQLKEACKKYGMKINTEKCRVISDSTTNLTIESEEIKIVKKFTFLGSLVSNLSADKVKATSLQYIDSTNCYIWF